MFEVLAFTGVLVLWAAFTGAFATTGGRALDSAWSRFNAQPIFLRGLEAFVLLPWVAALAAWESKWALWLRVSVVTGLAWVSLYVMFPWKAGL